MVDEFDWNPNCSDTIMLLLLKWATSLLNSTFSNTLENEGSNKICALLAISFLSPFLYRGFITEYFKHGGKIPVYSALLQIKFKGEIIKGVLILKIFLETLS